MKIITVMKLELKHLAPYLPYGVKISKIHTLSIGSSEGNGIGSINHVLKAVNEGKKQFKPILRPLSDLTKEIDVNGEKFVPVERLRSYGFVFNEYYEGDFSDWSMWSYEVATHLFTWHFDVFHLIPKDLAIDINTL